MTIIKKQENWNITETKRGTEKEVQNKTQTFNTKCKTTNINIPWESVG